MATSEEKKHRPEKERIDLLGSPTFMELENGRYRCVETGHELFEKDRESYSQSKRCRLGHIDYAVSRRKPPLNIFKQDPNSRSRLICKLTGDTVNKSEEHIWKHINGKRFLNKLEKKELENESNGSALKGDEARLKEKKKKKRDKKVDDEVNPDAMIDDGDSEEPKLWMRPVQECWDFDEGGDQWGSGLGLDEMEVDEED